MKFGLIATSILSSAVAFAEENGFGGAIIPRTGAELISVLALIFLTVAVILDRRKVAAADTTKALLAERDKHIAYLEESNARWERESDRNGKDLEEYRGMHHNYRDESNSRILKLSTENAALKTLLAENNIVYPVKS